MTFALTHLTNSAKGHITKQVVYETFKNNYEAEFKDQYLNETECFKENLFYLTVAFSPQLISIDEGIGYRTHPLTEWRKLSFIVNKHFLGNNLDRKRHLQPKGFAWVDFDGTRAGHGSVQFQKPHIHALILVRPEYRREYVTRMQIDWMRFPTIDNLKIDVFDSSRNSVSGLAGYCMKGLKGISNNNRQWLEHF